MNTNPEADQILYREEAYQLTGAAMEVYNTLGFGFLEAVYEEAFVHECRQRQIPVVSQVEFKIKYKDFTLFKSYVADVVAWEKIIVELKSVPAISSREEAQLLNYLKVTGFRLGLIINFGCPGRLEWKRMVS